MLNAYTSLLRRLVISTTLAAAAAFGGTAIGQSAPAVRVGGVDITGIPDNWSHHFVLFGDPGSEEQAIRGGHYAQWSKIVNSPLYVLQQLKKDMPVEGPAAVDANYREHWISEAADSRLMMPAGVGPAIGLGERERNSAFGFRKPIIPPSDIKKDWSMPLGGTGLAAGQYPAKYSAYWSTGTASCSDYVIFPTGATGSSSQATIVAFNNLYVGTTGNPCAASSPTTYWAYNTGGASDLSPVVSWDGTQVAYIQTSGGVASLIILKMANSGGVYNSPKTITQISNADNYKACTAPCYYAMILSGNHNDTQSAPYYDYGSDTIYVGDDSGYVHEITGVFGGDAAPAEVLSNGWPVQASTETSTTLTSPIYDPGGSTLVFVGDASGYLHSITTTGTTRTVLTSNQLECGTGGFVDPPLIDPTTENVYAFVGYGCNGTPSSSYVNRFAAGTSISASYGQNYANLGNSSTNTTSSILHAGSFDNQYFTGTGNSGNLYECENGVMYQITMATLSGTGTVTVNSFNTPVSTVGSAATCSPVTEFLGVKANTTLNAAISSVPATTTLSAPINHATAPASTTLASPINHSSAPATTTTTTSMTATSTTVGVNSATNIVAGDYIQIQSEDMQVTAKSGKTLTVTRGVNNTAPGSYNSGQTVTILTNLVNVTSAANILPGDYIHIASEYMYINSVNATGNILTVTRAANGSTEAKHSNGATVAISATLITVQTGASISAGNYILVNSEIMSVTAANTTTGIGLTLTVTRAQLGTTAATHTSGTSVEVLTQVSVASSASILAGDYIQIDAEIMLVDNVTGTTLVVTQGQLGTAAATHLNGAGVKDIKDWLFTSVEANGNAASCTGACLYNYNVIAGAASGTPTAGLAETGGTSGIVIDNLSTTQMGAEQIYFNNLGATTSNAIQTSQSNP